MKTTDEEFEYNPFDDNEQPTRSIKKPREDKQKQDDKKS